MPTLFNVLVSAVMMGPAVAALNTALTVATTMAATATYSKDIKPPSSVPRRLSAPEDLMRWDMGEIPEGNIFNRVMRLAETGSLPK
ncbi:MULTISPECIES: hypothetical protein [unclassified Bradyrhizobium]|uniref:hypothetical protein n=1 Tax=unclassified Bradyrhizobium TaxID=2631580 RepID=UPI0020B29E7F|nr:MULTISPECIES: hypothetical protein [unclassified Bradyrhizobium]MCP3401755.1 hypothetical protein [Bradyrhizobium sp. CCGB20]MCP3410262.1 hypothetical protein [Bradyrhizobium sp. CCGB01]